MRASPSVSSRRTGPAIGPYTLGQFRKMAQAFHGYSAPGMLIGGFMVTRARSMLPPGTLFEALVETPKCLPDAVQLLTPCSTGNRRMNVLDLGRYALTLYDKFTGDGWRVYIDVHRLESWPGIRTWFLKLKPKKEQDGPGLFREIEEAEGCFLGLQAVRVEEPWLRKEASGEIGICPVCGEAYPRRHGEACLGCSKGVPFAAIPVAPEEALSSPRPSGFTPPRSAFQADEGTH